jgi:hypothetical protein
MVESGTATILCIDLVERLGMAPDAARARAALAG